MTAEVLATTRMPPPVRSVGRRQRLAQLVAAVVVVTVILAMSLGRGGSGPEEAVFVSDRPPAVRILVLGDSSAGRGPCTGCPPYSEQLAEAVRRDGRTAYVDDRTWSANAWPSANLAGMTGALRVDPAAPDAVAAADVIVLAMGGYDVRLVDGTLCKRTATHGGATSSTIVSTCNRQGAIEVRQRMAELLAEISRLRHGRPVELRLVTPPPFPTAGADAGRDRHRADRSARRALKRLAAIECEEIASAGGACVAPEQQPGNHP